MGTYWLNKLCFHLGGNSTPAAVMYYVPQVCKRTPNNWYVLGVNFSQPVPFSTTYYASSLVTVWLERLCNIEYRGLITANLRGCGMQHSWHYLIYCACICLERLKKSQNTVVYIVKCFTWNANQTLPEYKSETSTHSVWCSWTGFNFLVLRVPFISLQ
jgi:hypothetical protein